MCDESHVYEKCAACWQGKGLDLLHEAFLKSLPYLRRHPGFDNLRATKVVLRKARLLGIDARKLSWRHARKLQALEALGRSWARRGGSRHGSV